jgi:osmoprotectant transport system permease protein
VGDLFAQIIAWFTNGEHWRGSEGIPAQVWTHLVYSVVATVIAAVIALPIGLLIGHTGKGAFLAINLSGFGRALPSFGVVILAFQLSGLSLVPIYLALVLLAVPVIVTNTYAGVAAVDHDVRDAARGVGLTGWQVLLQIEIPLAFPLILAGLRIATIQVVATATIAAYLGYGGLGRFVFDGLAQRDLAQALAGSVLLAVLAIALDQGLRALQRPLTPRGLRRSTSS